MFKKYMYISLVLLYAILDATEARCACDEPNKHYEELGCKPIYDKPEDCCPSHYDCDEIISRMTNTTSCYFNKTEIKDRENLDHELTAQNCVAACFCNKNEWSDFTCAHIDCPEFLGVFPLGNECIRQYKHNSCCTAGTACPPFNLIAHCKVGNKTYYEGQRFSPPNGECMNCICQKDFKGEYVEPFCYPRVCNIELKGFEVRKNCAPVYSEDDNCCPYHWQCQDANETKIIEKEAETKKAENKEAENKETKNTEAENKDIKVTDGVNACRFGNKLMKKGEKFSKKGEYGSDVTCECVIPPLLTCKS